MPVPPVSPPVSLSPGVGPAGPVGSAVGSAGPVGSPVGCVGPTVGCPPVVPPELPPPPVTLMVAAGFTASFGAHLVSVEIGLSTLMSYRSGVSVTSPGAVSFSRPFMSDSFMSPPLGIGGFCRGPSMAMSPVCAPAAFRTPVGRTVFSPRSRMSGFLEAAWTNFQTISTSSPTFASAGAVTSTFVVPWTGGSPEMAGGTHSVAYDTSAACAGAAATPSSTPAPPSIRAAPAALALRGRAVTLLRLLTGVPSWSQS